MFTEMFVRARTYFYFTLMTFVGCWTLAALLLVLPIRIVSLHAYRALSGAILEIAVPAFLLTPALAGLQVKVNKEHWAAQMHNRTWAPMTIVMCNHASRVDWMLALWCGYVDRTVRVSFLTEGPMQFLPIVGWMRKLCEDIFVWRSFKVDKPRIDANIESFKRTNTQRALFLAIEGAIVDKGEFDRQYIQECAAFCESLGYKPFEYVLTPRYKGVHALAQHAGTEVYSVTTAFVRDGKLMNKKLMDPARIVPDLFTILSAPTEVTCHFDRLDISAEQEVAKRQCMDNYKYRDMMIKHFDEKGVFPGGLSYDPLPRELPKRFGCLFFMLGCFYYGSVLTFGNGMALARFLVGLFAVLSSSHVLGEVLSGQSRESIPFETIFKSYLYAGRDERLLKKSKGKAAQPVEEMQPAEKLSETAKMFNLMTKFPAN